MSFNSNTTGVTCGAGTANPDLTPVLRGVRVFPVNSKLKIVAKQLICVNYVHELLHN
jgi:hypothetical protein